MNKLFLILICLAWLAIPGTALAADRDHDGLPDRWERRHHLSTAHGSANKDPDRDHVDNGNEFRERTSPRDRDTDGDGRRDGREDADHDRLSNRAEDATGNDPRDRDTDDDGVSDGRERAGVVLSFDDGLLTLDLANGGSLLGLVTDETKVKCISERAAERRHRGRKDGARKAQVGDDEGDDIDHGDDGEPDSGDDEPGDDEDDPGLEDEDWPYDEDKDSDEDGGHGDGGKHEGRSCGEGSLRPGVGVHEAELALTPEGLVFERVVLLR